MRAHPIENARKAATQGLRHEIEEVRMPSDTPSADNHRTAQTQPIHLPAQGAKRATPVVQTKRRP
ncbi:Uncharacterised protein [Xylophilus ampelinus]|nr:Uncharacterised protein [Xylophilus ampelinus]